MRVYRVGHADRTRPIQGTTGFPIGPYNGLPWDERPDGIRAMGSAHSGRGSESRHPNPYWDPQLHDIEPHEVCGFISLDALLSWFESWYRVLDEANFKVWVYDVPAEHVRVGWHGQTCFRAASAVAVSTDRLPLCHEQLDLLDPQGTPSQDQ